MRKGAETSSFPLVASSQRLSCSQIRRDRMTEAVLANLLSNNSNPRQCGANAVLQNAVRTEGLGPPTIGRARQLRMKLIVELLLAVPCYPPLQRRKSWTDIFDPFHYPVDVMIGPDDSSHAVLAFEPHSHNFILFL